MKLSRVSIFFMIALTLLFVSGQMIAQQGPPAIWTPVLNQVGQSSIASGNYYYAGGSSSNSILDTDLAGIRPVQNFLSFASNLSLPAAGGPVNCNGTKNFPVAFIESNKGSGITGLKFEGVFTSFTPLNQLSGNIFESVFFNENQCYGANGLGGNDESNANGREYGFFLATFDNSIWVYWGTNENNYGEVQAQLQLPTNVSANDEYTFQIYPTGNASSCGFQVSVTNISGVSIYNSWLSVDSNNFSTPGAQPTITAEDSGFCGAVTSPSGETGYVSANIEPASATVSGQLPQPTTLYLYLPSVFIGQN